MSKTAWLIFYRIIMSKHKLVKILAPFNQLHLLDFFDHLNDEERKELTEQIENIDFKYAIDVFENYSAIQSNRRTNVQQIRSEFYGSFANCTRVQLDQYWNTGLKAIAENQVAVVVLAGGQATRLGAENPKGTLSLGLLADNDSLLGLQAGQISKLQKLAKIAHPETDPQIHWYCKVKGVDHLEWSFFLPLSRFVMTSKATLATTKSHLTMLARTSVGLKLANVHIFTQDEMPCFTKEGRLILAEKHRIATSPDGNGGLYKALSPMLSKMVENGTKYLHIYCVDNILCRVADPIFLGYSIGNNADCAAKVVEKCDPQESVGILCTVDNVVKVIEYSEIDHNLATLKDVNNAEKLALRAGNIANHFFTVDFLQIVWSFYVWEVKREDEFSPLKNAESAGKDCLSTCRRDLWQLHLKWLTNAGGCLVKKPFQVEIDASLSYAGEGLESLVSGKIFRSPLCLK